MSEFEHPFRLRVLMALTDSLRQITVGNGYKHDLNEAVFRGRDLFGGEDDPVPMVAILEPPLPVDGLVPAPISPNTVGDWDMLIQGFVENDNAHPCDPAYLLLADVKRRLAFEKQRVQPGSRGTPDPFGLSINSNNVGNTVVQIIIGPGVVRPPGDGISDKAYFWLNITLKITEDIERPFL